MELTKSYILKSKVLKIKDFYYCKSVNKIYEIKNKGLERKRSKK